MSVGYDISASSSSSTDATSGNIGAISITGGGTGGGSTSLIVVGVLAFLGFFFWLDVKEK